MPLNLGGSAVNADSAVYSDLNIFLSLVLLVVSLVGIGHTSCVL